MQQHIDINACPLCGTAEFKIVFRKDIYSGKRCSKCSLVYISPRAADINKIYIDDESSSPSKYYLLSEKHDKQTFEKRLMIIEHYTDGLDFLDIGCNVGNFLAAAAKKGWNTLGIEPNPKAAKATKEKGYKVEQEFLTRSLSSKYKEQFDAAYIGDVIEHVEDPLNMIRLALNMLKKNGILMIVTPDFDSLIARQFQIKPLEHIIYFNRDSLCYAAGITGAKTELIKKTTRRRSLKALAYSTTFNGKPAQKKILQVLSAVRFDSLINIILELFVKDEILMVLRKQ